MKITRYKKAQRILTFYQNNFQFREPYQILVDGTFSLLALRMKINIKEQLPKYLGSDCDILTTGCCINETEKLGPELHGAVVILKQFILIPCGHTEKPLPASECLKRITRGENTDKYFVATQDQELRVKLRKQPAVPLIYLHHQAITLEKPSEKAVGVAKERQNEKIQPTVFQKEVLNELKKREFGEPSELPKKRKRRGPKMPNPLSCKKTKKIISKQKTISGKNLISTEKKAEAEAEGKAGAEAGRKRRHKRLKMSDALKSIHKKLVTETEGSQT